MIQRKYNRIRKLHILMLVVFCVLLGMQSVWAEGSKDLYPVGAIGGRGVLHFRHFSDDNAVSSFMPHPKGVHYAYAEEGEQIAIATATDAQRNSNPRIFLFDPSGNEISLSFDGQKGNIPNRIAELAGPKLPNQAPGGNYYEPIYANGGRAYPENANHIVFPNGTSSHVNGRIFGVKTDRLRPAFGFNTALDTVAILRSSNVEGPDATNQTVLFSTESLSFVKDGFLTNSSADGFVQIGETITYKIKLVNNGRINLYSIVLIDPLLGGTITAIPQKSINADNVLDVGETWTYTLRYTLTQEDLNRGGVYNQAKVRFRETMGGVIINKNSQPTIPLTPTDIGYDPDRFNYTFVSLKKQSLLITNPMIRQRIKK
ncbi:hypothetical protein [Myroides odoratus]|uniref:DUF7507 domain-containing protein n=1 Tax=Myroides odoratus TaxID=256 RepID=UPI00334250CA